MLKKTIIYNNQQFDIPYSVWEKHLQMHPVRSEEALQSNLFICLSDLKRVTSEDIVRVIEDEYDISSHIGDVLEKAKRCYAERSL